MPREERIDKKRALSLLKDKVASGEEMAREAGMPDGWLDDEKEYKELEAPREWIDEAEEVRDKFFDVCDIPEKKRDWDDWRNDSFVKKESERYMELKGYIFDLKKMILSLQRGCMAPSLLDRVKFRRELGDEEMVDLKHVCKSAGFLKTFGEIVDKENPDAVGKFDDIKKFCASLDDSSSALLESLSSDESDDVRLLVAANPKSTAKALSVLAGDDVEEVRWRVIENPKASQPTVGKAFSGLDLSLQGKFVTHYEEEGAGKVPPKFLEPLAFGERVPVSNAVSAKKLLAKNEKTPAQVLSTLSRDKDSDIRKIVAQNAAAPARTLSLLSLDVEHDVRSGVAENEEAPESVLKTLKDDPSESVSRRATRTLVSKKRREEE